MYPKALVILSEDLSDDQKKALFQIILNSKIEHEIVDVNPEECGLCGHKTKERKIAFFADLARALSLVWKYCRENNKHEFTRKEIKHLFTNENQTARFGDLILFGGLVYRPEDKNGHTQKGKYGLNIDRVSNFFANKLSIPTMITKKTVAGHSTYHKDNYKKLKDMPELYELLTDGQYKLF